MVDKGEQTPCVSSSESDDDHVEKQKTSGRQVRVAVPVVVASSLIAAFLVTTVGRKSLLDMESIINRQSIQTPPVPEGARDGDAYPWPNIHLATWGYNLYYGDPLPILNPEIDLAVHQTIMDPGLTKPLFVVEYTQSRKTGDNRHTQPDGFHATVDMGCSTIFTTKTIRDAYEYQSDQQQKVSLSARVEAAIKFPPPPGKGKSPADKVTVGVSGKAFARAGGTLSHQWRAIQSENTLRDQKMYRTAAKCSSYVVAYSFASPPKTHPDFQQAVGELRSDESFYKLFDEYGTHFLTTVRMGARYGSSIFVDNSKAEDMQKSADGFGLTLDLSIGAVAKVGVGYKGMSAGLKKVAKLEAKIPLITPKEKLAAHSFKSRFVKKQTNSVVGPPLPVEGVGMWHQEVNMNPVPIQWELSPICMHPSLIRDHAKYEACTQHLENYCDKHLKKKGAQCVPAAEKECYNDLDCKDDFVCRRYKCLAVPQCKVTLYRDNHHRGGSYQLETVTAIKHMGGKRFDLKNGNWHDHINSFKMSDGCMKVEAVDDDGSCALGKGDNGRYTSSVGSLPYDLQNDVCAMKVWAKPPPDANFKKAILMYLGGYTSAGSRKFTVEEGQDTCLGMSDCTGITCRDSKCTLRRGKELKGSPHGEVTWFKFDAISSRPDFGKATGKYLAGHASQVGSKQFAVDEGKAKCLGIPDCAGITCKDSKCTLRAGTELKASPTGEDTWFKFDKVSSSRRLSDHDTSDEQKPWVWVGSTMRQHRGTASSSSMTERDTPNDRHMPQVEPELSSPARRLQANIYLRNIGKAMYGYNHYFGAPSSAENAGTDPGFVHRPVWKSSYTRGTVVTVKSFNRIPKGGDDSDFIEVVGQAFMFFSKKLGYEKYDLQEAKDKCYTQETCTGITCSSSNDKCGLRTGKETKKSRSGDISWVKVSADPWLKAYDQHIGGWPTQSVGLRVIVNLDDAKKTCLATVDCTGITCDESGLREKCTLHTGKASSLQTSTGKRKRNAYALLSRISEQPDRRLSGLLVDGNSSYVFGPRRRLTTMEKVPDGWQVTKATKIICDKDFVTKEIKSQYDYEREESSSLNPLGLKLDLGMFTFSMSSEATEFRKSNAKSRKAMYKTSAECMDYVAEMDLDNPPPTADNFKFVVDAASEEHEYHSVFDMFGLHFPTTIIFGAKYGFTQNIDESSWSQVSSHSSSFNVGAEVTKGVKAKKGISPKVSLSATAGASYGEKDKESESQTFDSYFSEVKEFSLGRAMPNEGGVHEWVKLVDGEPMPIQYGLKPICDHPAFASKKGDCTKYSKTYCTGHLIKSMGGGVSCDKSEKPECLWDLDCPPHYTCTESNTCVQEPSCTVWLYGGSSFSGSVRTFGPLYYREAPMGKVFDTYDKADIDSVKVSGGCEEVLLMDADSGGCLERRDDNILIENRNGNHEKSLSNLPWDLEDDVCSIKLKTKEKWA